MTIKITGYSDYDSVDRILFDVANVLRNIAHDNEGTKIKDIEEDEADGQFITVKIDKD